MWRSMGVGVWVWVSKYVRDEVCLTPNGLCIGYMYTVGGRGGYGRPFSCIADLPDSPILTKAHRAGVSIIANGLCGISCFYYPTIPIS